MNAFQKKIDKWKMSLDTAAEMQTINEHVDQLESELYCDYEPTKGPYPSFWHRLERWVDNAKDEARQQQLFRLMQHIFFIGPHELDSLYRAAFNSQIARWLIDQNNISLDAPGAQQAVKDALRATWFCPLTDSMRINAFYHLNHLSGRNYRPDWLSLAKFGEPSKIDAYITGAAKIRYIVLLEDFVGSGSQIEPAVKFAGSLSSSTPTLVLPLVACPTGVQTGKAWESYYPQVTFRPVLELDDNHFVHPAPQPDEQASFTGFRELAIQTYKDVLGGQSEHEAKVYSAFGYDYTGGLVVLATNCPDNTLPLIHHHSSTWSALFPRASRI